MKNNFVVYNYYTFVLVFVYSILLMHFWFSLHVSMVEKLAIVAVRGSLSEFVVSPYARDFNHLFGHIWYLKGKRVLYL